MRKKITVVGAGNVGATAALFAAEKNLGDVVLTDIVEDMPQGKALDMLQTGPVHGYQASIKGTNDYADIAGSDVVVITAGLPRKPGMSRSDLLGTNAKIMTQVCEAVKTHAPNAIVIVVSNPLDIMCWVAKQVTGFPSERVIGMAGVLDTSRMRAFIAEAVPCYAQDVACMVLGGHGDSMVPITSSCTVSGVPLTDLLPQDKIDAIVARTRTGGGEIVKLLKTGSAYYAPAASAIEMVEAILLDSNRILPCAALPSGQYDLKDCYIGLPCQLGAGGLKRIIDMKLSEQEIKDLHASANAVKEDIAALANL